MAGRVCMVTGANSGIGFATAQKLAELGATVIVVCRNRDRGERAAEDIKLRSKNDSVELMRADLASLSSVRSLAEEYAKRQNKLHVLINNAGIANVRRRVTTDGFEATFQVNYLSSFLLTNLLLGLLTKSAPSRIVNISSTAHFSGRIHFDDLQMKKGYRVMKAYSQSKLALVLFTFELARRLRGTEVTANCLHPGTVATNMFGRALGPAAFLGKVSKLFLIGPDKGAETSVYLAASSEVEGVTGKYFDQMWERKASADSYDEALAGKLWNTTASLVGLNREG